VCSNLNWQSNFAQRKMLVKKVFSSLLGVSFCLCLKAQVSLGPNVSTFGVLGASTVTNTGATTIFGNLGLSPGTSVTGFPPGSVTGSINIATSFAGAAQNDLTTAYNVAANLPSNGANPSDLGGTTVFPGVYTSSSSLQLTGTVTLNALGNANAVFVFQMGTTLTTATNSAVVLINGASAANVYWQVGSSATIGSGTSFAGNILAQASISFGTGATLRGRALARTGAVTLLGNSITVPSPVIIVPTPTPTPLPTPSPTPAPSSLALVSIAMLFVVLYQARRRFKKPS
jgi:hypothetical protein